MIKQIGSQARENINDTDYEVFTRWNGAVVLRDKKTGAKELWQANNHFAGYTIQIGRWGYEFIRSVQA